MPDKDQTDEELMTLYLSGESRAFEVLYFRYGPKVRSFLLKRQVLPQEADELQQLVFLKFHTSRHSYDKQYLVAQWVFVISKSVLNDYFRKKKRQVLEDGDLSDDKIDRLNQEFVSSHRDQEALTIPDLSRLSKEQQTLIEHRVLSELSYSEIAKIVNKSEVSIRKTLSRIFKKLRTEANLEESKNE